MAVRPSSPPLLTFPALLISLSWIVPAAQVSNQPSLRDGVPASPPAPVPFQRLCHASTSYLTPVWAVIRRKVQRTLHAQLDFVDMVQVIALCSIVQAIRLWRKRSYSQEESPETSEASHARRNVGDGSKGPSQISLGTLRQGWFRSRMPWLSKNAHACCSREIRRRNY